MSNSNKILYVEDNQALPSALWLPDTEPVPNGCTAMNTIQGYHLYGKRAGMDYRQIHDAITDLALVGNGFSDLSFTDKDIVGIYRAADDNDIVNYYIADIFSGDVEQAVKFHAERVGEYVIALQKVANDRYHNPKVISTVMLYMKDTGYIDLFIAAIRKYVADYKMKFHLGIGWGDSTDGLINFIENTGGYPDRGQGLDAFQFSDLYKNVYYAMNSIDPQNPTAQQPDDAHIYVRNLLRDSLINKLVYGNFD